ncbi:FecR domain-containing protein [bacterium]|nr:FecR domain-containing protein [bacterium]
MKVEQIENWCVRALGGELTLRQRRRFDHFLCTSEDFRHIYDEMQTIWHDTEPLPFIPETKAEDSWCILEHRLGFSDKDVHSDTSFSKIFSKWINVHFRPVLGIAVVAATTLITWFSLTEKPTETEFLTVVTQNRQRTQINLADGSLVTLNSGSVLRYPKNFTAQTREVHLNGEGFFEIKSEERPFIVITEHAKTTVLGTRFIVQSRQNKTRVMVEEGRVRVESAHENDDVILSDGQMSEVLLNARPSLPELIDMDVVTGWLEGRVHFERTPVADVIMQLERYFDVKIEWQGQKIETSTITGAFHDAPIEVVLSSICLTLDANFHKEGDTYIITQ